MVAGWDGPEEGWVTMRRTTTTLVAGFALAGLAGVGIAAAAAGDGPGGRIGEILSGLVQKGTINQDQADAVEKALTDAREQDRAERQERLQDRMAAVDTLLQDTLGMTRQQVMDQLRAGKTLKQIAGDKSDELASGAVALAEQELAGAVSDGRLTQEQADRIATGLETRVSQWLAGTGDGRDLGPALGMLLGGGLGRGHGHPGGPGHMGGPGPTSDEGSPDGQSGATTGPARLTT